MDRGSATTRTGFVSVAALDLALTRMSSPTAWSIACVLNALCTFRPCSMTDYGLVTDEDCMHVEWAPSYPMPSQPGVVVYHCIECFRQTRLVQRPDGRFDDLGPPH